MKKVEEFSDENGVICTRTTTRDGSVTTEWTVSVNDGLRRLASKLYDHGTISAHSVMTLDGKKTEKLSQHLVEQVTSSNLEGFDWSFKLYELEDRKKGKCLKKK
jgi:hypothetical protein